jgi:tRNA-binding protein
MNIQNLKPQVTFGKFDNIDMRVAKVISAPMAQDTRSPCRVITLDLGSFGQRISVGQYALVDEKDLVGRNVVACVNLGQREIGSYVSDALLLGAPHPESPEDQSQATPIYVSDLVQLGSRIF